MLHKVRSRNKSYAAIISHIKGAGSRHDPRIFSQWDRDFHRTAKGSRSRQWRTWRRRWQRKVPITTHIQNELGRIRLIAIRTNNKDSEAPSILNRVLMDMWNDAGTRFDILFARGYCTCGAVSSQSDTGSRRWITPHIHKIKEDKLTWLWETSRRTFSMRNRVTASAGNFRQFKFGHGLWSMRKDLLEGAGEFKLWRS